MKRILASATLLLATLAGCGGDRPLVPRLRAPGGDPAAPSATISDAVHSAGRPHFYFLPPMVSAPTTAGTFDATVSPAVEICVWGGSACTSLVARFTMTSGVGSEVVRVNTTDQSYVVNWHTDQFNLDPALTYRIRALVGAVQLGFADVDVVANAKELRNVNTNEYIPLLDDRTLPIRFRIENGFLATIAVAPDPSTVRLDETVTLTATAYDLHGQPMAATFDWSSSDAAKASVSGAGVVTGNALGGATVSATAAGTTGSAAVTVTVGAPKSVAVSAGDNQTGVVGTALGVAPAVVVKDAHGNPTPGIAVSFAVGSGGGSATGTSATTDANGVATVGSWTSGTAAGAQTLTATVTGDGITGNPLTFQATAIAGAPASVAPSAGDGQSALVSAAVAVPPAVRVADTYGNPVPGASVTFAVATGGGSVTGASATTDANGIATVGGWTLGAATGAQTLTATVAGNGIGGNPVTFTATATVGAPASVAIYAGNNQTATVNSAVAIAPAVRVTDAHGNPTPGIAVTFTPFSGSSVTGGSTTTDANGVATPGSWKLGQYAQLYGLAVTVAGDGITGNGLLFQATATPGAPASISVAFGDNQSAGVGNFVSSGLAARVFDAFGNTVSGAQVTFAVATGGGAITGTNPATSDASGYASLIGWRLGTIAGPQTLTATVTSPAGFTGTPATFTATAIAGPAVAIAISAGNNQTAPASTAVPIAPAVIVTDSYGNGKPGITVNFYVNSGGGSLTGGTTTTNASGIATVGSWTLGPSAGVQTFMAIANGISGQVYFTATATCVSSCWEPLASMSVGRYILGAALVGGKMYAVGGYNGVTTFATNEEYDPSTNSWTTKASMPTARFGPAVAALNGRVYAAGGYGSGYRNTLEAYDPSTNTWSTAAPMLATRYGAGAASVNGVLYVFGGQSASLNAQSSVEAYDPSTNSWTAKAPMANARFFPSVAVIGGRIYVSGGRNQNSTDVAATEVYDPAANTWTTLASSPAATFAAAGAELNGSFWTVGGVAAGNIVATVRAYDPIANTWSQKPDIPSTRYGAAAVNINGKLYVAGGYNGAYLTTLHVYKP